MSNSSKESWQQLIARARERDRRSGIEGLCVLCACGIPGGSGRASGYHHIVPKSNCVRSELRSALRNLAPTCPEHHIAFQRQPEIWIAHMIKCGLHRRSEYEILPWSKFLT